MLTRTMKAVRQCEFSGPDVLRYEDAPLPDIKPAGIDHVVEQKKPQRPFNFKNWSPSPDD